MNTKIKISEDFYDIRIPVSEAFNNSTIKKFVDYIRIKEITSNSSASNEEISQLAKEVNKDYWEKNKSILLLV